MSCRSNVYSTLSIFTSDRSSDASLRVLSNLRTITDCCLYILNMFRGLKSFFSHKGRYNLDNLTTFCVVFRPPSCPSFIYINPISEEDSLFYMNNSRAYNHPMIPDIVVFIINKEFRTMWFIWLMVVIKDRYVSVINSCIYIDLVELRIATFNMRVYKESGVRSELNGSIVSRVLHCFQYFTTSYY